MKWERTLFGRLFRNATNQLHKNKEYHERFMIGSNPKKPEWNHCSFVYVTRPVGMIDNGYYWFLSSIEIKNVDSSRWFYEQIYYTNHPDLGGFRHQLERIDYKFGERITFSQLPKSILNNLNSKITNPF